MFSKLFGAAAVATTATAQFQPTGRGLDFVIPFNRMLADQTNTYNAQKATLTSYFTVALSATCSRTADCTDSVAAIATRTKCY